MSFQSGVIRRGQSNDHQGARSRSRDTLISSVRNLSQPNPFKQHLQGFNYSRQPTIQPPLPRQNYSSAHFDSRTTQQWPPAYQHIAHPNGGPSQMVEANGSLYSDNQYDDHSNGYATPVRNDQYASERLGAHSGVLHNLWNRINMQWEHFWSILYSDPLRSNIGL